MGNYYGSTLRTFKDLIENSPLVCNVEDSLLYHTLLRLIKPGLYIAIRCGTKPVPLACTIGTGILQPFKFIWKPLFKCCQQPQSS